MQSDTYLQIELKTLDIINSQISQTYDEQNMKLSNFFHSAALFGNSSSKKQYLIEMRLAAFGKYITKPLTSFWEYASYDNKTNLNSDKRQIWKNPKICFNIKISDLPVSTLLVFKIHENFSPRKNKLVGSSCMSLFDLTSELKQDYQNVTIWEQKEPDILNSLNTTTPSSTENLECGDFEGLSCTQEEEKAKFEKKLWMLRFRRSQEQPNKRKKQNFSSSPKLQQNSSENEEKDSTTILDQTSDVIQRCLNEYTQKENLLETSKERANNSSATVSRLRNAKKEREEIFDIGQLPKKLNYLQRKETQEWLSGITCSLINGLNKRIQERKEKANSLNEKDGLISPKHSQSLLEEKSGITLVVHLSTVFDAQNYVDYVKNVAFGKSTTVSYGNDQKLSVELEKISPKEGHFSNWEIAMSNTYIVDAEICLARTALFDKKRSLIPSFKDQKTLDSIAATPNINYFFKSFTQSEIELLWKFRHWISKKKEFCVKYLLSFDWWKIGEETRKSCDNFLSKWENKIEHMDALILLSSKFAGNEIVRDYAVKIISESLNKPVNDGKSAESLDKSVNEGSSKEFEFILPQLIQGLRYEYAIKIKDSSMKNYSPKDSEIEKWAGYVPKLYSEKYKDNESQKAFINDHLEAFIIRKSTYKIEKLSPPPGVIFESINHVSLMNTNATLEIGSLAIFLVETALKSFSLFSSIYWNLSVAAAENSYFGEYCQFLMKLLESKANELNCNPLQLKSDPLRSICLKIDNKRPETKFFGKSLSVQKKFMKFLFSTGKKLKEAPVAFENLKSILEEETKSWVDQNLFGEGETKELKNLTSILKPQVNVEKIVAGSVFKSKQKPFVLTLDITPSAGVSDASKITKDTEKFIFKIGDDLRKDQLLLQCLSAIDALLRKNGHEMNLTPYSVLPSIVENENCGCVQFVENSSTLSSIEKSGNVLEYLWKRNSRTTDEFPAQISKFLEESVFDKEDDQKTQPNSSGFTQSSASEEKLKSKHIDKKYLKFKTALTTYFKSLAAYTVITFLLGIGDRHNDNIMIAEDGRFFHIDFSYCFGDEPTGKGAFASEMYVPTEVLIGIAGNEKIMSEKMIDRFKKKCGDVYTILRQHANEIMNLFLLFQDSEVFAKTKEETVRKIRFLQDRLKLEYKTEEARKALENSIDKSRNNRANYYMKLAHNVKQGM